MIDRDTAIQWAADAGVEDTRTGYWLFTLDHLQILIARAQNEAFEQAAMTIELYDDATMKHDYMLDSSECAGIIRALKQE